ncbi:acyl-CoA thioesterase [Undibacterium sp. TC4M20W]|uniref:acyl-CoA thioesterase n=1 Tax=Undibacterium sp. TC4M20W TaxID=3413052 RepID=UPI003BF107BF
MHPFDKAITLKLMDDGRFRGQTSPDYANMIGPFGGTTAASLLQAAMQHESRIGDPIALTVNFAAALADGDFDISCRPVRTNRSTQHWSLELIQAGEVAASASAVFALRRDTWSAPEAVPPEMPSAHTLAPLPSGASVKWVSRYEMRFERGGLPVHQDSEMQNNSETRMWIRDEPARPLDFVSLAALCDSFFPRIFVRRRKFVPMGTVSLTTYFHADAALLLKQGDRPVLGVAQAKSFRNGYFDQAAEIWSDDGQLLANSNQIVYYRE